MSAQFLSDVERCVDEIIARVGKTLVVGLPLGLGKPNQLTNALYRRAKADPTLSLRILTALTLEKPAPSAPLEKAFMAPILARIFGDYEDVEYIVDLRRGQLPANVEVHEFFFRPGAFLDNPHAQQHYICSNYTHAARDVFANGCNVAMQLVARREVEGETRLSLSCNPDTAPELVRLMRAERARSGKPCVSVAQVHRDLPYMYNDAEVAADAFDLVLDNPALDRKLFGTPKDAVGSADYFIGLQASSLVRDGGTLQIGIGAIGDAITQALILRERDNAAYTGLLRDSGILARTARASKRSAAPHRSRRACTAPPRCSSTDFFTCTRPASCAGASTTSRRCSAS